MAVYAGFQALPEMLALALRALLAFVLITSAGALAAWLVVSAPIAVARRLRSRPTGRYARRGIRQLEHYLTEQAPHHP